MNQNKNDGKTSLRSAEPNGQDPLAMEMIAKRAYEISQSSEAGSDEENWLRAERELAGMGQRAVSA